ncbi:MAG: YfhO family protein [Anaerolineales bacterium]|nr:YfhO family protein [Anaerolineales bacterium]
MAFPSVVSGVKRFLLRLDPVYALLAAVLVFLFAPVLLGTRVIFWGLPLLQFAPWHETAKQTLLAGYLPLWNPWLGMGAPLLANAQSALLYPPNWILLIVPVEYGQGLLMVAHLLWAGIGMAKLSRRLGIGLLGQAASGLAFMLSGYLASRAWFLSINASVAWLPWIVLASERALRKEKGILDLRLALALCLQWLAGHWQTAWYTWWIAVGWMAVRAVADRPAGKALVRAGLRMLGASLAAALLGAAQFIPTAAYWLNSQRASGVDPEAALTYSFWPWRLVTLVAPNFFGNPAHGDYWGYANYWEDAVYIGLLPLGLAVSALVDRLRRRGAAGFPYGYLAALAGFSLLLGLGKNTPVFPFLFAHVPSFNFFQAPSRMTIGFVFALCLLAAAGAQRWQQSASTSWRTAANIGVASAAALAAGIAATYLAFIRRDTFAPSVAATGGIGILIALLALLKYLAKRRPPLARWVAPAAAALIALDLGLAAAGLVPTAPPSLYREENPAAAGIAATLGERRIYMPEAIRYELMYHRAFLFRIFAGLADWMDVRRWELPNVCILDSLPAADNFDSFVPRRYAVLVREVETLPAELRDRLLGMMDVGAVWEWPPGDGDPTLRYLSGGARAWGVCRAQWALGGEDALRAVTAEQFDPARTVILEAGSGEEGTDCASPPRVEIAAGADPNRVRIEVDFAQDGFLVLADVNDDGWQAFLDGERVPNLQADYAFRAVRVPAGRHTVEFRYAPPAFWGGALASVGALLALCAAAAVRLMRRTRRRAPPAGSPETAG